MADVTRTIEIVVDSDKATKDVKDLNEALDQNQKEVKKTKEETKGYKKITEDTGKATEGLVGKLDEMTGGLISSTKQLFNSIKALKTFKIALAATGIGAIIVAVGTLVTAFKRLPGPMRLIEDTIAAVDSAIDAAISSLGIFASGLALIASGEFKAGFDILVNGFKKVKDAAQERFELSQEERDFRKREADELLRISELERRIEQLKLTSESDAIPRQQRLEAANKAYKLQEERVKSLIAIERERIALDAIRAKVTIENDEEYIERINRQQEGNERIATLEGQLVELNNSRNVLIKESNTLLQEQKNLTDELIDDWDILFQNFNESASLWERNIEATTKKLEQTQETLLDINNNIADEQNKTSKDLADGYGIAEQAATSLLDVLSGKVKGKDIFKSVLNTVTKILSFIPGIGQGASLVGNLVSGIFADGGIIKGPSHSAGGVIIEAEGGEAVINKRSMDIPGVKEIASYLNELGGGLKFADGGIVPTQTATEQQLAQIQQSILQERIVLPIPDFRTELTKVISIEEKANL